MEDFGELTSPGAHLLLGQEGDLDFSLDLALGPAPPPLAQQGQQQRAPPPHGGMAYGSLAPYTPLPAHLGCASSPGVLMGLALGAPQQEGQQHPPTSANTIYGAGSSTSGGSAAAVHAAAPPAHQGGALSLQQQLAGLHRQQAQPFINAHILQLQRVQQQAAASAAAAGGAALAAPAGVHLVVPPGWPAGAPLKAEPPAEGQGSHNGHSKQPLSAASSLEGVVAAPAGCHDEAVGPLSAPAPPPAAPPAEPAAPPAVASSRRRTRSITQQEAEVAAAVAASGAAAMPEAVAVAVAPGDGGKGSERQGGQKRPAVGEGEERPKRQRKRKRSPSLSLSPSSSPSSSPPKPRRRPRAPAGGGGDAPERSSRYRGVTRHKRSGRFEAHIWVKELGRQVYLGGFEEEEQAAEAYDIMAIKAKGTAASTNFGLDRYDELLASVGRMGVEELVMAIRRQSQGFSRGTSSYRGVTRHPSGRYEARIGIPGSKHIYLGLFEIEADAARAYDRALVRLRGRAAATNFGHGGYGADVVAWEEMQARLLRGCARAADVQGQHKLLETWLKGGRVFDEAEEAGGSAARQQPAERQEVKEEEQEAAE